MWCISMSNLVIHFWYDQNDMALLTLCIGCQESGINSGSEGRGGSI